MDEKSFRAIALQLRKPQGEYAIEVGEKMNEGKWLINLHTIEALCLQNNDKILEIGMGNGFFVKDILAKGRSIKYTGCDISKAMIEEANKYNKEFVEKEQAEFHLTSSDNLPFENNVFDKVFTVNTIYFWVNPEEDLAEILRVLKTDGKLIISVRPKSEMQDYPMTKYGFNMFSKIDLEKLLSKNKFKIIEFKSEKEPEQEFLDTKSMVSSLIVSAEKI